MSQDHHDNRPSTNPNAAEPSVHKSKLETPNDLSNKSLTSGKTDGVIITCIAILIIATVLILIVAFPDKMLELWSLIASAVGLTVALGGSAFPKVSRPLAIVGLIIGLGGLILSAIPFWGL